METREAKSWRAKAVIASLAMFLLLIPAVKVHAAELSGTCGDNLTWEKTEKAGVLTINGYGDMYDYNPYAGYHAPWTIYAPQDPEDYKIQKINLPDGLTRIGDYAFRSEYFFDWITKIEIPDSVTSIGKYSFSDCKALKTLKLPGNLRNIEEHAFWHCENLRGTIAIPYGMTTIGEGTFSGCKKLSGIEIPNTVKTIGVAAFLECYGLTSVTIPNSVTEIQDSAFNSCTGLTEFVIPDGVKKIATWTFGNCTNLRSITIPENVTSIGYMAFDGCNISDIYFKGSKSQWEAMSIGEKNDGLTNATIHFGANDNVVNPEGTRNLEWENINGKSYWYEDGIRQGTSSDSKCFSYDGTLRGREIYDPNSDGWYWLDVNANGAKAVGKEVFMPYIYQNEAGWNNEEINNNANASGANADGNIEHAELAGQVRDAIKNGTGKWVRYDNNGKMLKGWVKIEGSLADLYPNQAGNVYYYDRKTGLMAKGKTVIGGTTYYFDEVTGVLK